MKAPFCITLQLLAGISNLIHAYRDFEIMVVIKSAIFLFSVLIKKHLYYYIVSYFNIL